MSAQQNNQPISFKIAMWYGFIFSGIFLLYGGVQIILSFLDRNYSSLGQMIFFAVLGLVLIMFAIAFKELKKWGWYGLIGINSLVIIYSLLGYQRYENIILMVISAVMLYLLFSPLTKKYLSKQG